ncbi:MAG TPA: hypothetical protein VMU35_07160, partial [Methylomirabilota bacterium]|nr:hypothetical protein [Methylomirabilota bacterium]
FCGPTSDHIRKLEEEGHHVHEAPMIMLVPYVILAVATVVIGLTGPYVEEFFTRSLSFSATPIAANSQLSPFVEQHAVLISSLGSLIMLALGGGFGYLIYISKRLDPGLIVRQSGISRTVYNFLWNRWYINPIYYRVFVNGTISLATDLWKTIELGFFDKISGAVATVSLDISQGGQGLDMGIVDGAVNGIASMGRRISLSLKRMQTGIPQDYVTVFALGLFALVVAILFFLI